MVVFGRIFVREASLCRVWRHLRVGIAFPRIGVLNGQLGRLEVGPCTFQCVKISYLEDFERIFWVGLLQRKVSGSDRCHVFKSGVSVGAVAAPQSWATAVAKLGRWDCETRFRWKGVFFL